MQHRRILAALSLALALPATLLAQSDLQLPSGQDDYRELLEEPRSGPCERCGVVTGIRTQSREAARPRNPAATARRDTGGIGGNLTTTPIIGTGSVVADARKAAAPVISYVITVRYEDGSFAFIDQDDEPAVSKGDRVRVVEGRVELRSD